MQIYANQVKKSNPYSRHLITKQWGGLLRLVLSEFRRGVEMQANR